MAVRITYFIALVVTLTASCGVSFANDTCKTAFRISVQPILNANCVACHQDAAQAQGLSLQRTSAPMSILGVGSRESKLLLVAPGKPEQSYLFRKISGTHLDVGGRGDRMPLGMGKLDAEDMDAIKNWINTCSVE